VTVEELRHIDIEPWQRIIAMNDMVIFAVEMDFVFDLLKSCVKVVMDFQ